MRAPPPQPTSAMFRLDRSRISVAITERRCWWVILEGAGHAICADFITAATACFKTAMLTLWRRDKFQMLLIAILTLLTIAALNYCLAKRLFYPPLVFCLVWAVDLAIVALAGRFFYPISEQT